MVQHDRYKIFRRINAGGMAEIYLGAIIGNDGSQKICAIKKVLDDLDDEDYIKMFMDEIKTSSLMHHVNIVQTYGSDVVEGATCLIMEYVQGVDLEYLLYHCKKTEVFLSVPMSVYIVSEAAQGLSYAHGLKDPVSDESLGIIHRDISPSNVIISYEGEVKVSDFGIAKSHLSSSKTQAGVIKGKFSYMSPEYVAGEKIDHRADIYSLGVVLWEMLAGKKLHKPGDTRSKSLLEMFIDRKNRRKLTLLNPDVDQALEDIVERCLCKNPVERYQTTSELHKDLVHYLNVRDPKFNRGKLGSFLKTMLAKDYNRTRKYIKDAHLTLREMTNSVPADRVLPVASGGEFAAHNPQTIPSASLHAEPPPPSPGAIEGRMPGGGLAEAASRGHSNHHGHGGHAHGAIKKSSERFVPGLIGSDNYVAKGKELELDEQDSRKVVNLRTDGSGQSSRNRVVSGRRQVNRNAAPLSRAPASHLPSQLRSRSRKALGTTKYHKEPSSVGINILLIILIIALLAAAALLYRKKVGSLDLGDLDFEDEAKVTATLE